MSYEHWVEHVMCRHVNFDMIKTILHMETATVSYSLPTTCRARAGGHQKSSHLFYPFPNSCQMDTIAVYRLRS